MTTIAYRDGVLASDSLAVLDNSTRLPGSAKKLWKLADGTVAGGSGDAFAVAKALNGINAVGDIKVEGFGNDSVLSIAPDGVIRVHSKGGTIEMRGSPYFAIGSGATIALTAMQGGASAKEAIQAAARLDVWTGGDVHTANVAFSASAIASQPTVAKSWLQRLCTRLLSSQDRTKP